jgi:predicted Fe-Mo cluster-binding NifX family protein
VRIAIPISQGRVSPVFDVAARLVIVQTAARGAVSRSEVSLEQAPPEAAAKRLREWAIDTLVCGAISQEYKCALEQAGLRVISHICGDFESVLQASLAGNLRSSQFVMPGCCRRRRGNRGRACGCQHSTRAPKSVTP